MTAKSLTKAWAFTCVLCGESRVIWRPLLDVTLKDAQARARAAGWKKTAAHGWVHKDCLKKQSSEGDGKA